MNSRYSLIICFLIMGVAQILRPTMQPMIMLFDWKYEYMNKNFGTVEGNGDNALGFVTNMLARALADKAAPILVTGSLWRNFIERRKLFQDLVAQNDRSHYYAQRFPYFKNKKHFTDLQHKAKEIVQKKAHQPIPLKEIDNRLILPYLTADADFNPADWMMKKLSSFLYLLVPRNNPDAQSGLNVHEETFADVSSDMLTVDTFAAGGVNNLDNELMDVLKKMFVLNKKDIASQQEWLIYIGGHGRIPGENPVYIAAMEEATFKKLLQFFNNNITTKFLMYNTCFAGGERSVRPYQTEYEILKNISETRADVFNYTIVAAITFYLPVFRMLEFAVANFSKGFAEVEAYFDKPAIKIDTALQYLHPTFIPATPSDLKIMDQSLDTFLGLKGNSSYKVPLYYDQYFYIKKFDVGGSINIVGQTNLYQRGDEIFIDPTIKGAVERDSALGTGPGDSVFFTEEQKNKGQTAQLVLQKNTGVVFNFRNKYYFAWHSPKQAMDQLRSLQVPAIRFPGTGWFYTTDVDEKVQRISRIEALTAQADKQPLMTIAKQVVIFDTQSPLVPYTRDKEEHAALGTFEIKQQKLFKSPPHIMLIAPMDAQLYFEKIDSQYGFIDLLNEFMPLQDYQYARTFYGKKVICKNDLTAHDAQTIGAQQGGTLEIEDMTIFSNASLVKNGPRYNGVLFTYKGKKFSSLWPASDANSYKMLQEKKGMPFLKSINYTFVYPYPADLEEYKKIAIIKTALEKKLKQGPELPEIKKIETPVHTKPEQKETPASVQQPQKETPTQQPTKQGTAQEAKQSVLEQKLQELRQALQNLSKALAT